MATKVTMDGAEYNKYLALEQKLKECNGNFTIERYWNDSYDEYGSIFKLHTDNESVKALKKILKTLRKKAKKKEKKFNEFRCKIRNMKDTDTQKKVVELMGHL